MESGCGTGNEGTESTAGGKVGGTEAVGGLRRGPGIGVGFRQEGCFRVEVETITGAPTIVQATVVNGDRVPGTAVTWNSISGLPERNGKGPLRGPSRRRRG